MLVSFLEKQIINDCAKYVYSVKTMDDEKNLWISLSNDYSAYFCEDRLDGLLIILLLSAMKIGEDIHLNLPISESLLFKVQKYLIPFLCEINKKLKPISIVCDTIPDIKQDNNVIATGISCGVDSLSTIAYHSDKDKFPNETVNCLTLFNSGYYGRDELSHERYKKYIQQSQDFCAEHNLPLLLVDSNIYEFMNFSFYAMNTYFTCGIALMLQKGIRKYLYSSGYPVFNFAPNFEHVALYDTFLLHCISTRNLEFVSSCCSLTRVEKLELISNTDNFIDYLYVCTSGDVTRNCAACEKCVRTLLAADSLNKLDRLETKFNLDLFKKNRNKYIAFMLRKKRTNIFYKEIYNSYKKHKIKLPFASLLYFFVPTQIDIKNFIEWCSKMKKAIIKRK